MPNIILSQKREHSRKPEDLYSIIEQCSPEPYLELFARHSRPGWVSWGNEVDKEEAQELQLFKAASYTEHKTGNLQLSLCETPTPGHQEDVL